MPRAASKGTCRFCNGVYGKAGMTAHLAAYKQRAIELEGENQQTGRRERYLQLLVAGRHSPIYWMHIEIPAMATLADLDRFLRNEWVECCDHLSAFEIARRSYESHADAFGGGAKRMQTTRLQNVLSPGEQFSYEYDFGSTTELSLKVVAVRTGLLRKQAIVILAQNDPPEIPCGECGRQATIVCMECRWDEGGWLCDACAETHECGEDMFLPVINSPRVGVCGYSG